MKLSLLVPARPVALFMILAAWVLPAFAAGDGWIELFDGRTLDGWKASENPASFRVVDGAIAGDGPRAHLFYTAREFENFELIAEVKAMPHANSGVYFHLQWEDKGWPTHSGFEVQVNNTQDPFEVGAPGSHNVYLENKKTGSLYGVRNVYKALARDGEWFTLRILVEQPRVRVWVNGIQTVDYIEPANEIVGSDGHKLNRLGRGMFALQCHDEKSQVFYRKVSVRPLPPGVDASVVRPVADAAEMQRRALGKDNFPLVDLQTRLQGGLTLAQALDVSHATGMSFGVVAAARDDTAARAFLALMKEQAMFAGLQVTNAEGSGRLSKEMRAQFDYLLGDAMPAASAAGGENAEAVMDELVAQTVRLIQTEPIDVCANVTVLPASLKDRYGELWTEARMKQVIDAAAQAGVALELNARHKTPSEKFVRLAKAAGVKFTMGTGNTSAKDWGDWSYPLELQKKIGLVWRDMWVPGHAPSRAQREAGK